MELRESSTRNLGMHDLITVVSKSGTCSHWFREQYFSGSTTAERGGRCWGMWRFPCRAAGKSFKMPAHLGVVSCSINADEKHLLGLLAAGFGSSSQCTQRTVGSYSFCEFIPRQINLRYTAFQAIAELFDMPTQGQ